MNHARTVNPSACEGNESSTWTIQILGPCTLNVSYNTRELWINARRTRRCTSVTRRAADAARTCAVRARAQRPMQRSTPNIYTSIHLRRVEAPTLTDVARCRLNRLPRPFPYASQRNSPHLPTEKSRAFLELNAVVLELGS